MKLCIISAQKNDFDNSFPTDPFSIKTAIPLAIITLKTAFGHPVAMCWNMLGVVMAQILKWSNFPCNICECCMSFGQVRTTMLRLGMRTSSIFNSQHVATRRNTVAKRVQHVAPNNVAIFNCWDSLAGA